MNSKALIKVSGVTFENRQQVCKKITAGCKLQLLKEPNNPYDEHAVKVLFNGEMCGYIPKEISYTISKMIDSTIKEYEGIVREVVGGGDYNVGLKIELVEKTQNELNPNFSDLLSDWVDNDSFEKQQSEHEGSYLTDEQRAIVDCEISENSALKVIAFAGTGKTTTLLEYTKKRPGNSFLYIAFNKSVQEEAIKKFPFNVTCKTSHALAFNSIGSQYKAKLINTLRFNDLLKFLSINDNKDGYRMVKLIYGTLCNYMSSADNKFSISHFQTERIKADSNQLKATVIKLAAKVFMAMIDLNDKRIGMLHDGYLKLFQLSNPILNYDYILLDEAQDTTPALSDIILKQKCKKILVGDPHQQIYSFRGAENAMEKINAETTLYLTQSFRFTDEIAKIGTKILRDFKSEKKSIIGKVDEDAKHSKKKETATICRTNGKVFEAAVSCGALKIHFIGGISGYNFNELLDIYYLKKKETDKIKSKYIQSFTTYEKLTLFAEEADDLEIKSKLKIIDKYDHEIPFLIQNIHSRVVGEKENADMILSTAHKAKGSEFYRVKIADDFPSLIDHNNNGELVVKDKYPQDEFNLQYVAVTRAMYEIEFEDSGHWRAYLNESKNDFCNSSPQDISPPEKSIVIPIINYPMLYIEPEKFLKGCKNFKKCFGSDRDCEPTEVTLEKSFFIGRDPVSAEQFSKIIKCSTRSLNSDGKDNKNFSISEKNSKLDNIFIGFFPDILNFLKELNLRLNGFPSNIKMMLPTEAEWEYCCNFLYGCHDNSSEFCLNQKTPSPMKNSLGINHMLEFPEVTRDEEDDEHNPFKVVIVKGGLHHDRYCVADRRIIDANSWCDETNSFRLLLYGNYDDFKYLDRKHIQKFKKITVLSEDDPLAIDLTYPAYDRHDAFSSEHYRRFYNNFNYYKVDKEDCEDDVPF